MKLQSGRRNDGEPSSTTSDRNRASNKQCRRRSCARMIRWTWLILSLLTTFSLVRIFRSSLAIYLPDLSISDQPWSSIEEEDDMLQQQLQPPYYHDSQKRIVFYNGKPFLPRMVSIRVPSVLSDVEDVTQTYPFMDSADVPEMELKTFPRHESDPQCVPMADWQTKSFPNCNEFHTLNFLEQFDKNLLSLLSQRGFWRHAWELNSTSAEEGESSQEQGQHDDSLVLKTIKLQHNMEEAFFENNRVDALAMERLTSSPYVTNIYGHCGMSLITEYAGQQIPEIANQLSSIQKLRLGKRVALGVAAVHGIEQQQGNNNYNKVSLVHNDLNFANVLVKSSGIPVINDFNLAVLVMRNNDTNATCKFQSRFPSAQWKSPEEQVNTVATTAQTSGQLLTYKIDIYALGNVLFRLAVGKSPWKSDKSGSLSPEEKQLVALQKATNGTLPPIPQEIMGNPDPAIQALLQATISCYQFDPNKRPTARQVAKSLTQTMVHIRESRRRRM